MSPDFISTNIMPASSGDPVSAALQHSLNGSRKRFNTEDLDQKLIGSAKRVLLTEIQYEETSSYDTSILENLKSKYIVLSATNSCVENIENKVKNGSKESHNKLQSMSKSDVLPKPKRVLYPPGLIQLGWQGAVPVGAGLINLGNTCYMNSTLQALFHVPAFVNWLLNDKVHTSKCESLNGMTHTECLICAMKKTLLFTHHNSGSAIKPIQIYNKLKLICKHLNHGQQEDAHEFLRYLIESMEKSYITIVQANNLDNFSKETTPLNQIFGGYIRTEVTCLECRHVSTTFSHFQDLLIDIRQSNNLDEGLDSYFGREILGDGEEAYKCEQCHKRVAATKKFSLERPPKVLCVQLKRFGTLGGKNNKHISISLTLDLTKYCHKEWVIGGKRYRYRLVSLVSHIGPSSNCGHYTAVGQTSDGRYYLFDDTTVRYINESNLSNANSNTYIIMYEMEPSPFAESNIKIASTSLPVSINGVNGKNHQNNNCTPQKSSQMKVPYFNKSPQSSQAQSPSTSSSVTPKHTKPADNCSQNKSLVPYTANESSDSETDQIQPSLLKQNVLTTNGIVKESSKINMNLVFSPTKTNIVKQGTITVKTNLNIPSLSTKTNGCLNLNITNKNGIVTNGKSPVKEQSSILFNKWHITEVSAHSPSGSSTHTTANNWNVTESSSNKVNGEKAEPEKEQAHVKPMENGNGSGTSRTWDGNRQNETVDHLLKLSHRGYGSNVTCWDGGRTQIDREVDNERLMQRKRYHDQEYDDELDSGKVKKVKNNYMKNNNHRDRFGRRYNAFQDHQNRKNSWHNNRQQFYRQYGGNHHYNKGHKGHHHNGYQNRNGYRWH